MTQAGKPSLKQRLSLGLIGNQLPSDWSYILSPRPGAVGYALQVSLAGILSLLVAFYFQLESPYWAAATAILVATPTHGQTLSKGFFRLLGTVIGGVVAVLLMSVFAQASDLFILLFALWIGLCTYAGTLMRNFRMYAAALSGYTAAIIVFSAAHRPENVLDIALARVAANSCGIVVTALVSLMFARTSAMQILRVAMTQSLNGAADLFSQTALTGSTEELRRRAHRLIQQVTTLDSLVEFAAAESSRIKRHREELRVVIASLMNSLTANWGLARSMAAKGMERIEADAELREFLQEASALLKRMGHHAPHEAMLELGREIGFFGKKYRRYLQEVIRHGDVDSYRTLIVLKNMRRIVDQLSIAQETWGAYLSGATPGRKGRMAYDFNTRRAFINGFRSFTAVLAAGVFWVETAWPDGSSMFMMTAITCSLLSSSIQPVRSTVSFIVGGLLPLVVAFFCYLFLLPDIDGFPLLAAIMGLLTFVSYLHCDPTRPDLTMVFSSTAVNFVMFLRFTNPMSYDLQGFINNSIGMMCGMFCAYLAFTLVFPVLPRDEIARTIGRFLEEIRTLAGMTRTAVQSIWESRMYDRLPHIMSFLAMERQATRLLLGDFFSVIHIGVELIGLKNLAYTTKAGEQLKTAIADATAQLVEFGINNELIAGRLEASANQLFREGVHDDAGRADYYHAAASMFEIAYLINEHQRILTEAQKVA
ncbi:MAG: FUSC family protein [Verrucomicrobiales bacterium]|jgi:uncharacterized membrane protein YccC|nr:FUSC family protein [Verrucomicrobiales bacterium]